MGRWRKKPVEVEAVQWLGSPGHAQDIVEWIESYNAEAFITPNGDLMISTLEGDMQVTPKDYVIKGVKGEFYPCKPDIFIATYEAVEEPFSVQYNVDGTIRSTTGKPPTCYSCGGPYNGGVDLVVDNNGYRHGTCPDSPLPVEATPGSPNVHSHGPNVSVPR